MFNRRTLAAGLVAAVVAILPTAPALADGKVSVFAAASLKNALDEVSAAWKADTGKETSNTFAASSALAKQIEAGAPADVFISADLDWMKYLADKQMITPGSEVKLLGNTLVLIVPAGSTAAASSVGAGRSADPMEDTGLVRMDTSDTSGTGLGSFDAGSGDDWDSAGNDSW